MTKKFKGIILGLCLTAFLVPVCGAQQSPSTAVSQNLQKIQQIRQDIFSLQGQAVPMQLEIQKLMTRVVILRGKLSSIEKKIYVDRQQLQPLVMSVRNKK